MATPSASATASNADDAALRQYNNRAYGQMMIGPYRGVGGTSDSNVMRVTVQEVDFGDSLQAQKYMNSLGTRTPNKKTMMNSRRLKQSVANSDD